jgi:hypothetical protein
MQIIVYSHLPTKLCQQFFMKDLPMGEEKLLLHRECSSRKFSNAYMLGGRGLLALISLTTKSDLHFSHPKLQA